MPPIRCPECGLLNIPERQICKRCRTTLVRPPAERVAQNLPSSSTHQTAHALQRYLGLVQDILSPLPYTVATERLATLVQKADAGTLQYSDYRFNARLIGATFTLYGPHGNRAWPLVTTGHLVSTSTGTQLSVTIRPALLYPIIFAAGLGWWIWNAMSILRGAFLLFPIGALFVAVAVVLASVLSEKKIITDMLVDVLSVEPVILVEEERET